MAVTTRSGRSTNNQQAQPDASSNSNPTATNEATGAGRGSGRGGATATQTLASKVNQLLQQKDDFDDSDLAYMLLHMLKENGSSENSAELSVDQIKDILQAFKLKLQSCKESKIRSRLRNIIDFPLDKFDDTNTIQELSNQDNRDELVIYFLKVTRCLPNNCKNLNKTDLANLIVAAKKGDIDYYPNLSYIEVRNEFEELARGLGYRIQPKKRFTLVQNFHEAKGNYENKSDDWIENEATELQLRAELKRLNLSGEAIDGATNKDQGNTKDQLKAAVLKLRRELQVPPPPANSLSEDSMDQGEVQLSTSNKGKDPEGAIGNGGSRTVNKGSPGEVRGLHPPAQSSDEDKQKEGEGNHSPSQEKWSTGSTHARRVVQKGFAAARKILYPGRTTNPPPPETAPPSTKVNTYKVKVEEGSMFGLVDALGKMKNKIAANKKED